MMDGTCLPRLTQRVLSALDGMRFRLELQAQADGAAASPCRFLYFFRFFLFLPWWIEI